MKRTVVCIVYINRNRVFPFNRSRGLQSPWVINRGEGQSNVLGLEPPAYTNITRKLVGFSTVVGYLTHTSQSSSLRTWETSYKSCWWINKLAGSKARPFEELILYMNFTPLDTGTHYVVHAGFESQSSCLSFPRRIIGMRHYTQPSPPWVSLTFEILYTLEQSLLIYLPTLWKVREHSEYNRI